MPRILAEQWIKVNKDGSGDMHCIAMIYKERFCLIDPLYDILPKDLSARAYGCQCWDDMSDHAGSLLSEIRDS